VTRVRVGRQLFFQTGAVNFSLRHRFQTGSEFHSVPNPMVPTALSLE